MTLSLLTIHSQDGQSRQGSVTASPIIGFSPPRRAGTASSLPPYSHSPPRLGSGQEQSSPRAKTPSDLLGLKPNHQEGRSGQGLGSEKFKYLLEGDDGGNKSFHSPETSPLALRPSKALADVSEWGEDTLKPLESRQGTETEVAVGSPDSLGIFLSPPDSSQKSTRSVTGASYSPGWNLRKTSLPASLVQAPEANLQESQDHAVLEAVMDNLRGVKMYVSLC